MSFIGSGVDVGTKRLSVDTRLPRRQLVRQGWFCNVYQEAIIALVM